MTARKRLALFFPIAATVLLSAGCNKQEAAPAASGGGDLPATAARTVAFAAAVKPILDKHCANCHLEGNKKGGFSLDTREEGIAAGRHGVRIVAGNSTGSDLIMRVASTSKGKMPPKGERLTADEVGVLRAWIDQGAQW